MSRKQIKIFQNKLKESLPPEINLNFMSYDIDTKIPKDDLIIWNGNQKLNSFFKVSFSVKFYLAIFRCIL